MGQTCCGNPDQSNNGAHQSFEVNNHGSSKASMVANMEGYEQDLRSSKARPKIEPVNEAEVEHKADYPLGDGATYTGQMKQVQDN